MNLKKIVFIVIIILPLEIISLQSLGKVYLHT